MKLQHELRDLSLKVQQVEKHVEMVADELDETPQGEQYQEAYGAIERAIANLSSAIGSLEQPVEPEEKTDHLTIEYVDSHGDWSSREIIPLYTYVMHGGGWHSSRQVLMAMDVEKGEPRNFRIDRIHEPKNVIAILTEMGINDNSNEAHTRRS